jgi:branched-chain amino acid transport system permease protein
MPIDLQQALLSGLFLGSIYGLIAVGFAIIFGVMRVSTFAHGELVMLGSYAMVLVGASCSRFRWPARSAVSQVS